MLARNCVLTWYMFYTCITVWPWSPMRTWQQSQTYITQYHNREQYRGQHLNKMLHLIVSLQAGSFFSISLQAWALSNFQNIANFLIMLVYSFACVCPPTLQTEPLRLLTKYLSLTDTWTHLADINCKQLRNSWFWPRIASPQANTWVGN